LSSYSPSNLYIVVVKNYIHLVESVKCSLFFNKIRGIIQNPFLFGTVLNKVFYIKIKIKKIAGFLKKTINESLCRPTLLLPG